MRLGEAHKGLLDAVAKTKISAGSRTRSIVSIFLPAHRKSINPISIQIAVAVDKTAFQ
jgi:hypothetical protein